MLVNLNIPYNSKPSPPHRQEMAFYSKQSDSLLFNACDVIEIYCRSTLRGIGMQWALSRNLFKQPFMFGEAVPMPANTFVINIPTSGLYPGFYDLRVLLDNGDENKTEGICTFGFNVDSMEVHDSCPHNFTEFWESAKNELDNIPLAAKAEKTRTYKGSEIDEYNLMHAGLPGAYDPEGHIYDEIDVYKVDFVGIGGIRIHGWLAKPNRAGIFPAMLVFPGAGFASRPIPLEHAKHGYLALDIQVHGQEVDLEKYEQLPGYYSDMVYEPVKAYYYYNVYLNCVQAVNYLCSRCDVDVNRIVAVGGSQGGRLSMVVAALDKRIKAIVAGITHNAYIAYTKWAEASNNAEPAYDGMGHKSAPVLTDTAENKCLAYYDVMNFAPDITCSVLMNAGMIDPVSPPTCIYSAYKLLSSRDKQIIALPGLAHDWSAEFDRRAWRWLKERLKDK